MSEAEFAATRPDQMAFDDRVDTETEISSADSLKLLGRSLKLLKDVKLLFAGKFAFAAVSMLPALLIPWVAKIIIDQVLLEKPFGTTEVRFPPFMNPFINLVGDMSPMGIMGTIVAMYGILLVLFGTRGPAGGSFVYLAQGQDSATQSEVALSQGNSSAGGLWGVSEMMINIRLTQRIANMLRTRLFARLTHLPMTTLDDHRIGDSVYRVMYDTPQVSSICYTLTITPVLTIAFAGITLYLMQYSYGEVAPELVWIAGGLIPLALVVTFPLSGIARRLNQASRASGTATTNAIEESMENIAAVQSLGGSEQETEKFEQRSSESFKRFRFVFLFNQILFVLGFMCAGSLAIYVTIQITNGIIDGVMSPGDFGVLLGLFYSIGGTALAIGTYWINLQSNVAAVRRVFFFLDYDAEDSDTEGQILNPLETNVTLDHVDFSYPNGPQVLTDINLELSLGELVAFVGPTGAGKTSLAYLLPGFLRPTAGKVCFDRIDTASANLASLRDQVSYVFQEHILLSESIRANLLLAKPDATDEEMLAACKTAGALEFIETLPDGLDTVLGRSGDTLSVGQQQRLCIARGLIRDTRILILDEPTAALDPETENALVSALLTEAKGKLVVVIAHRLSTIRKADRIVFLQEGKVMDVGSHAELMSDPKSAYRTFVELQNG
jgi:ABC-type multidrug transport system fused ATPase/permease subunit